MLLMAASFLSYCKVVPLGPPYKLPGANLPISLSRLPNNCSNKPYRHRCCIRSQHSLTPTHTKKIIETGTALRVKPAMTRGGSYNEIAPPPNIWQRAKSKYHQTSPKARKKKLTLKKCNSAH